VWTWRKTERFGHPEVFALILLASLVVARFAPLLAIPYTCPLRGLTGIPCATCGMTHAFVHLAHGEVGAALAASPLGAALAFAGWLLAALDLLRAARGWPLPIPAPGLARGAIALGVVLLLVNWAFLVARGLGA
jgi:hypothetical protein